MLSIQVKLRMLFLLRERTPDPMMTASRSMFNNWHNLGFKLNIWTCFCRLWCCRVGVKLVLLLDFENIKFMLVCFLLWIIFELLKEKYQVCYACLKNQDVRKNVITICLNYVTSQTWSSSEILGLQCWDLSLSHSVHIYWSQPTVMIWDVWAKPKM